MERQKRGFYLIKRSVAVQNVDWGRYLHMCQRIYRTLDRTFHRTLAYRTYRQGTFHQWTGNPLSLSSIDRSAESVQSLQSSVCRAGLLTLPSLNPAFLLSFLASFPIAGLLAFLDLTFQLTRRGTEARHES